MEERAYDLNHLRQADTYIKNALNLLKDVDSFTDENYKMLDYMNQDIEDLIMKLEVEREAV